MSSLRGLWVCVFGALIALILGCGSDQGPGNNLTITPDDVSVEVSSAQVFTVDYGGQSPTVKWFVDDVQGGTTKTGLITSTGLYVAPADVPAGGIVTLKAHALGDTIAEGTAKIRITKTDLTPFITVTPETASVWGDDSVQFAGHVTGCSPDSVVWSVSTLWGSPLTDGLMHTSGLYISPLAPVAKFAVLIKATSVGCPQKVGVATVVVYVPVEEFNVELESFTEKYDVPGGDGIRAGSCGGASGGYVVKGMDKAGEWIKVPITVPASGTYRAYLRYQANSGSVIGASMTTADCGSSGAEIDFMLEQGAGMG